MVLGAAQFYVYMAWIIIFFCIEITDGSWHKILFWTILKIITVLCKAFQCPASSSGFRLEFYICVYMLTFNFI